MLNELFVLSKLREGDIKVFEAIFRRYHPPLCLYAGSITGEREVAEEIVQELFYTLWRERERIQLFHSLKSYLYGATRNRSLQYLEHREVRNRYRETYLAGEQEANRTATPQEQMEYSELEALIQRTLQQLPERRLRIFRMHRLEGLKYAEIATTLSLSLKTVEAEMTKALRTLRKEIELYTA